ncbi:MAG: hypothetical protein J6S75_12430 [Thermoguttaceae bacterium]|nr:hypothetical protein [Thermoguttaceae bacterium]
MPAWFYLDTAGTWHGPVNDTRLLALARSGIIAPGTTLRTDTGQIGPAGQVRGLFRPPAESPFVSEPGPTPAGGRDRRAAADISTHETQAAIQMVTWNFFCGLIALNHARAAGKAKANGNFAEARRQASIAKWWLAAGWVSTAVLLAGLILLAVVVFQKLKEYQWFG